ncbi:hypothetical protein D0869_02481 [Hortaea werneckii]|uniref:DUF7727 domain-containing protein n=1 Tax=Hortaea werneckii TaxID=91943 RepID=A0A3M6ZTB0_HORWE|nr:hypothetical protein D0869_02481 [Hortaea werneckii]RMY18451.1 hypothetical protein D0867_05325 [Hortaea werneckii]
MQPHTPAQQAPRRVYHSVSLLCPSLRMGKLIKNHWARLIIMTAACSAALEGFFWPKILFDFLTKTLDGAVKPYPVLQTLNLVFAFISLAYEWPLKFVAGTSLHKSIEARMLWLPLCSLSCILLYQATNPGLYYLIGSGVYFWAYTEGEVVCAVPWTLPKRSDRKPRIDKV